MLVCTLNIDGTATIALPWAPDNRTWLWAAMGAGRDASGHQKAPRRPMRPAWNARARIWTTTETGARRVYATATAEGRAAELRRWYRPDTERCTDACQRASLQTVDRCTCPCGGQHHG